MAGYVSEIFMKKPDRYGLRGDPFFWDYLKEYFATKELPYSVTQFTEDIYSLFWQVTGEKLTVEARPFVEEFAHGGMSSGHLSGEFWIERGIPLLVERLEECGLSL